MKRTSALLCISVLFLMAAVDARAGLDGKLGFGPRIYYDDYGGSSDLDYTNQYYKLALDQGYHGGLNWTYFVTNEFSFELSIEYDKTKLTVAIEDKPAEDTADLVQVPVSVAFHFMPPIADKWKPYLGVGMGYSWCDYRPDYLEDMRRMDGYIFYNICAGVDYFITDSISLGLDARYNIGESVWHEPMLDFRERVDMTAFFVGIGAKYYWTPKEPSH